MNRTPSSGNGSSSTALGSPLAPGSAAARAPIAHGSFYGQRPAPPLSPTLHILSSRYRDSPGARAASSNADAGNQIAEASNGSGVAAAGQQGCSGGAEAGAGCRPDASEPQPQQQQRRKVVRRLWGGVVGDLRPDTGFGAQALLPGPAHLAAESNLSRSQGGMLTMMDDAEALDGSGSTTHRATLDPRTSGTGHSGGKKGGGGGGVLERLIRQSSGGSKHGRAVPCESPTSSKKRARPMGLTSKKVRSPLTPADKRYLAMMSEGSPRKPPRRRITGAAPATPKHDDSSDGSGGSGAETGGAGLAGVFRSRGQGREVPGNLGTSSLLGSFYGPSAAGR